MGKFSTAVNVWACIWTLFVSVIFILPTERPVTALTMNYAIAFLGLILGFSTIYWYISGKKFYTGPVIEATDEDSLRNSMDHDSRQEKVENKKWNHETWGLGYDFIFYF